MADLTLTPTLDKYFGGAPFSGSEFLIGGGAWLPFLWPIWIQGVCAKKILKL